MLEGRKLFLLSLATFGFAFLIYFLVSNPLLEVVKNVGDKEDYLVSTELNTVDITEETGSNENDNNGEIRHDPLVESMDPGREQSLPLQYLQNCKHLPISSIFVYHRVKRGDTLYGIMAGLGLSGPEANDLVKVAAPVYDLRKLIVGNLLRLAKDKSRFQYLIDDKSYLEVVFQPETTASIEHIAFEKSLIRYNGQIRSSLFETFQNKNIDSSLAMELAQIFEWDIDFSTEIQNDDEFNFLVERLSISDKLVGYGRIVAAQFSNNGKNYSAYYFDDNAGSDGYYDEQGRSLRKAFLKSPLRFNRISSYFMLRRFHPVLKVAKAHLGIDYAAPHGTPVRSIGRGRVILSGWKGGLGKSVFVKHNRTYTTVYGHLSRISPRASQGDVVNQGEVIGYVGTTGLSTGPHLHFGLKRNDSYVNPLSIVVPPTVPIDARYREVFQKLRDEYSNKLSDLTLTAITDLNTATN